MTARALLCATLLLLFGCALPQRHVDVLPLNNGSEVITYPADLRGAYVNASGRTCAEPVPDVAMVSAEKLAGALKLISETGQSIEASAKADLAANVAELSGRTSLVLLARDLLFRACEMNADPEASVALFNRVADLVERLGRADQDRAAAHLAAAMKHSGAIFGERP